MIRQRVLWSWTSDRKGPAPERAQPVMQHSKVVSNRWELLTTAGDFRNWCATDDQVQWTGNASMWISGKQLHSVS